MKHTHHFLSCGRLRHKHPRTADKRALAEVSVLLLAAVADLAALQAKLQTLHGLAAGVQQHRLAVHVAGELVPGRLLGGRAAAGAGVAAGGAQGVQAGGAGLQESQEEHGALAPQARQQQPQTRVCSCG